jgi:hypothetical protein
MNLDLNAFLRARSLWWLTMSNREALKTLKEHPDLTRLVGELDQIAAGCRMSELRDRLESMEVTRG